jgi:hypothetical protein
LRPTADRTITLIDVEECPMRHIVMTIIIVVVIAVTAFLRDIDAYASMSTANLRLFVIAAALPPLIAAFTWQPRVVLVTVVFVLLLTLMAVPLSDRWADLGLVVGLLVVADVLAVVLAVLREYAIRCVEERAGLAEIRKALAEQYNLAAFAVPVQCQGETVGVLTYERVARTSERFTAEDRSRLAVIATLCAAKIDSSQPSAPAAI